MKPFRFRADVALQLRRREHDRALASLARAQAALGAALQHIEEADRVLHEADDQLKHAMQAPNAQAPLTWYRSWRVKLRGEREMCDERLRAREGEVAKATTDANRMQQRVRSLERLHDNALAAWRRDEHLEEQRTMDALATLRFTRRDERTHSD